MWKSGPLPPETWNYGGVVTQESVPWFAFADFRGDHAVLADGERGWNRRTFCSTVTA